MNYFIDLTGGMNIRRTPMLAAYGFLGVGATPSNIYADVQTTIRIAATSSSANRLIAGATYPI